MNAGMKKKLTWAVLIALLCPLLVTILYKADIFDRPEHAAYDTLVKIFRKPLKASPDVAIIMIDETSIKAMDSLVGRWPWPRLVYADLLDFLSLGGARAVAFDILFTEREPDPTGLTPRGELGTNDLSLATATASAGNVYHAQQIYRDIEDEINKDLLDKPMPEEFIELHAMKNVQVPGWYRTGRSNTFNIPLPEIYQFTRGMGVVEFRPDIDGVFRRTRPVREYQGNFFPVMALAPVLDLLDIRDISIDGRTMHLDDIEVPLDSDGNYLINMYGKFNSYSISGVFASIQKMLQGEVEDLMVYPDEFKDKIVFIGASAVGVEDLKPTPISIRTPGVMLHASMASNILEGDFLRESPRWVTVAALFVLSVIAAFSVILPPRLSFRLPVPAAAAVLYLAMVIWQFKGGVLMAVATPLGGLALSLTCAFVYLSATEGREKRKVRRMLGQYVSPHVLSELVDRPDDVIRAEVGTREHITLLFSDIRGFTTISENMEPDRIVSMLNRYFSLWSDVIFKYDGTIDKFVGDAVMALWGAPLRIEDHARKAVLAACEMVRRLPELNRELEAEGYQPIRIGIGINTGHAILGNIGSERKLDYTVIGDTVNLASRVEGLTKQYACDILVTEFTYSALGGEVPCLPIDEVKVKGKDIPVKIYKVEHRQVGI